MEKLALKIQKVISPVADWMSRNKYIMGLAHAMQILVPIVLVGSFANLLANLGFVEYQAFLTQYGFKIIFQTISFYTLSFVALFVVFLISYLVAKELEHVDPIQAGLTALVAFLIITPFGLLGDVKTGLITAGRALPFTWLGTTGYFSAIVLGMLVPALMNWFIKRKIYIKMPQGVPAIVTDAFAALVPATFIFVSCSLISFFLTRTSFASLHQVIFTLIQTPLKAIGTSFPAYLTIQMSGTLAFFCGIHYNSVASVITPFLNIAALENQAAFAAGTPIPNIINAAFNIYAQPGGVGGTLGLALAMTFFSKSSRFKILSKVALIPAIFNINEPLIFGVPIMLNPILLIPYILTPFICINISYWSTVFGLVARLPGIAVGYTIPMVLSALMSGGGVSGAILQVVLVLVSIAIWFPFFKIIDQKALEEENLVKV